MKRAFAALVLLLPLAACGGTITNNQKAAVIKALKGAEDAAAVYVRLPLCPQPAGALCSDAGISAKMKAADTIASNSAAGLVQGTITLAQAMEDIGALATLIPAK